MRRTVSMVLAALLAAGIVAVVPEAASAATGCSRSWHYITHAETGLNLRPDPTQHQGNTGIQADAVPGTDYWNQQFLFCRDPGWSAGHYAIYSNLTKKYWGVTASDAVYAGDDSIVNTRQLFNVIRYDVNFWVIAYVGWPWYPKWVSPDHTPGFNHQVMLTEGPLNGNHLFRISPTNLLG